MVYFKILLAKNAKQYVAIVPSVMVVQFLNRVVRLVFTFANIVILSESVKDIRRFLHACLRLFWLYAAFRLAEGNLLHAKRPPFAPQRWPFVIS